MNHFSILDDTDVWMMLKEATENNDIVLSSLAKMLLERNLPRIELSNQSFEEAILVKKREEIVKKWGVSFEEASYFVFNGSFRIQGYLHEENPIQLCDQDGNCRLFDSSPEIAFMDTLTKKDRKHFLVYPKDEGYFS